MPSNYDRLLREANDKPLGKCLASALAAADAAELPELARWIRLELLRWHAPHMRADESVPEYRTIGGEWYDEYGRLFLITDPKLTFINETRLRQGVLELESFVGAPGAISMGDALGAAVIREHLHVNVSVFTFTPQSVVQVLANIRGELVSRLIEHRANLDHSRRTSEPPKSEDIIQLKPNLYGIGIDLRALWRRFQSRAE